MAPNESASPRERIAGALEHARHILPTQAPIRVFVHHNTLHALEDLPFEEAVVRGAEIFGGEPYESEEAFARHLASGRILPIDIEEELAEASASKKPIVPRGPSTRELHLRRLLRPIERVEGPALEWLLEDGDALARFDEGADATAREAVLRSAAKALGLGAATAPQALRALWERLAPHAPRPARAAVGPRPRDRVLASHGVDVDERTHPVLIRICAAFVDQGIAYWTMPGREHGLLDAFRDLYARRLGPPDPWMRGLAAKLETTRPLDAEELVEHLFEALEVPERRWDEVIEATLRALPGWAGMMAQLEERPDRAPVKAPPARLADFLALSLLLEEHAIEHVLRGEGSDEPRPAASPERDLATVYEAFVMAQVTGVGPAELDDPRHARAFVEAVAAFDSLARRRLWHLAYERHHRHDVLDGMLAHAALGIPEVSSPRCQALFCIDEREESLRRHLEELDGTMETLGFAGFYGVPMAYQGLTDVRPTPLCPVVIQPKHLVVEAPIEEAHGRSSAARRQLIGKMQHSSLVGSQTVVRGGLLSASLGLASAVPLVGRVLFPRLAERLAHGIEHATAGAPATRLKIERGEDEGPNEEGLFPGFTVAEMADIVAGVLKTTGIAERLAPLVVVVGHGSSSLNNPHEAAHDCGATGGGRGGPNARAFSAMANHPGVRALLAERGAPIPAETWFVGAYHNTCDDGIDWYDVDLVPEAHVSELTRLHAVFEQGRRLDAHERSRRFESAPLGIDPEAALAHVEGRAVDLGEPRPEYGHATNAICIVGHRDRTRGLFLDRRAFLVSYDPASDENGDVLGPLLASVGPVGAGINLEYYFSFVDNEGYGSGTKLPHNVVGLVGVMNGHASDLRTGLPWQMVEIHEPVRLLTIVEAEPAQLAALLEKHPGVARIVLNRWIQVVAWSPSTGEMSFFAKDGFVPHRPRTDAIRTVRRSADHYGGQRGHLKTARIEAALPTEAAR
ncbi:MAG: DUF2309 domain-containing protein [Myxococcales bacterium]|nr:DUF2309 domain-containing protein [Myxococcales bacterium]